ncbi:MAG: ABC transporter permease [Christensenellaceae bacterium]|jgi:putative ABC transport system permease protein
MTFIDIVKLAAQNLLRRKMRTLLTVLGVIIGTACIVIMVALGIGNLEQFNEYVMQSTDLTRIEVYSRGMGDQSSLTDAKLNQFRELRGVKGATGMMEMPAYIKMGKYTYDTWIMAVDPESMEFNFIEGSGFSDSSNIELIVGSDARQYFQDPNNPTDWMAGMVYMGGGGYMMDENYETPVGPDVDWAGATITFYPANSWQLEQESTPDSPAPKEYRGMITGVFDQPADEIYQVFISIPAANKLIRDNRKLMDQQGVKEGVYTRGYIYAEDVDAVPDILETVKGMGFEAYSPTEWINQMKDEQARQQSQLISIGLISLLVSAIGIANTMLASILERRREIGVMKVIGLGINKINLMFLVEAAMIGLVGGLIGLGISYGFGLISRFGSGQISFLGMYFENGVVLSIPWWLALGAVAIAAGVGIVSGIYPAWKATKLSPLEAIRGGE